MKVLVTGGRGDIGKEIVSQLLAANDEVVSVDSKPAERAGEPRLTETVVDLRDWQTWPDLVTTADCYEGLVNCAGIFPNQDGKAYGQQERIDLMTVNVFAAEALTRQLSDSFLSSCLRVVNIGSVAKAGSLDPLYGASKAALASLTASQAALYPNMGIWCLEPGPVLGTGMMGRITPERLAHYRGAGNLPDATQVAYQAVWLLKTNHIIPSGSCL